MLTSDPKKFRRRTPTEKQMRAFQLRFLKGYSKARAMREAGYSPSSARNHAKMVFESRAALIFFKKWFSGLSGDEIRKME